jgi:1,4-dihydroxy-2-naphthoate octaprenyltransferase
MPLTSVIAASCLIGGYYPLTQIYQHKEDIRDGVKTISYVLGKKGTFVFCGIVFSTATIALFFTFQQQNGLRNFWLFMLCMFPMVWFFCWWAVQVWKDERAANFKNSLIMNVLASICTSICFLIIIIQKQFE